jgi:hypothetical protein
VWVVKLILLARARRSARPNGDAVLAQRVHSAVAAAISHVDSLQISVRDGLVTIWGPVRAHEAEALTRTLQNLVSGSSSEFVSQNIIFRSLSKS